MHIYHIFLIQSSVNGHFVCFHVLAIVNTAAINMWEHVSFLKKIFLTPVRWPSLLSSQINSGGGLEKREPSCTLVGMEAGITTMENSMDVPQKIIHRTNI